MATRLGPHSVRLTILLGAVAALPPLAIDMSLPALRDIGQALHGPRVQLQEEPRIAIVGRPAHGNQPDQPIPLVIGAVMTKVNRLRPVQRQGDDDPQP